MAFSYKNFTGSAALGNAAKKKEKYSADYRESDNVSALYKDWQAKQATKPTQWTGGQYGADVNKALDDIINRKAFNYDFNGDALYQQYKDMYMRQGKMAMADTMGQAAALNGGYGTSYAQTAGQQTYNGYMQQLNNVLPELYQLALQKYQAEGDELNNRYGLLKNQYDTEYGEYRNAMSDWNSDVERAYNIYNAERANEQSQYNTNREYAANNYNNMYSQEYGAYADAYDRAFANYQQDQSDYWNQKDYDLASAKADQSARIAELEAQLEALKGTDYSDWTGADWIEYFDSIRSTKGKAAAEKELNELASSGKLPKKYMATAATAARGKLGH